MNTTLTNSTQPAAWQNQVLPIFLISIYTLNLLLGLPLNLYVIIHLFPSRGVMEASDVFSWNQAVSDMLFVLLGPFHILCSIDMDLCSLEPSGFILGTSFASRGLFQSCVCVERYLAVVHPVTFLRYKPLRYRVACSIAVWVCSLAIGITCLCTFPKMPFTVFSAIYLLVLTVDSFCCVSILRKLRDPGPGDKERDAGEMNAAKRRAFQVVCVNLLLFLIQNIPVAVAFGLAKTLSEVEFSMVGTISLGFNILTELLRPVYTLYRAGTLPVMQATTSSTCCPCSGPTKST